MKPAARSPLDPHGNRLITWKEIAVYLDREVRTVQRWEKREGLPVRRHFHVNGGTVYASKKEIDAWLRRRRQAPSEPALKKECSEHGAEWLNPTLLAAIPHAPWSAASL